MSYVTPCVLALHHHLKRSLVTCYLLTDQLKALQDSSSKRFEGIFIANQMCETQVSPTTPYANPIYGMSLVLDPAFGFLWIDIDGPPTAVAKESVKNDIKRKFLSNP